MDWTWSPKLVVVPADGTEAQQLQHPYDRNRLPNRCVINSRHFTSFREEEPVHSCAGKFFHRGNAEIRPNRIGHYSRNICRAQVQ